MNIFRHAERDRNQPFSQQPEKVVDLTGKSEALGQTSTGKRGVHNQTSNEEVHNLTSSEDEYESSDDEGGAKQKRKTVQPKKKKKAETLTPIEWCQKLCAIATANKMGPNLHVGIIGIAMSSINRYVPFVSGSKTQVTKAQFLTELFRHSEETVASVAALKAFCSHLMK